MASEELDALKGKELIRARMTYTVRVINDEWEETKPFRKVGLDAQEAIEYLLQLLDQDEQDAAEVSLVPETLIPVRGYVVEGFYRA